MLITLSIPSVHDNEVVEVRVEEWHHSQPVVHDLVQLTLVATGLVLHIVFCRLKVRYNHGGVVNVYQVAFGCSQLSVNKLYCLEFD